MIKKGGDLVAAVIARDAAAVGRDATVAMVARKGRASYLGERSVSIWIPVQLPCRCSSTHSPLSSRVERDGGNRCCLPQPGAGPRGREPCAADGARSSSAHRDRGRHPDDRLGTDPVAVAEAVVSADDGEGVVVIMDLGSAVLSAELALELLSKPASEPGWFPLPLSKAPLLPSSRRWRCSARRCRPGGRGGAPCQGRSAGPTSPPTGVEDSITSPASVLAKAVIVNPDGIHARPAALIVASVASLDARVTIATDRSAPVSARSPTALMSLGARIGDVLRIEADGADAAAAVDRIVALVGDGFPNSGPRPRQAGNQWRLPAELASDRSQPWAGRRALRMPDPIAEPDPTIRIPEAERPAAIDRLATAAAETAEQLRSRSTAAGPVGELLEASAVMATDPDLIADANRRIQDRGLTPERAVWEAIGSIADTIRAAGPRQAERVSDLYDIRDRMAASLTGCAIQAYQTRDTPSSCSQLILRRRTLPGSMNALPGHPHRGGGATRIPRSSLGRSAFRPSSAYLVRPPSRWDAAAGRRHHRGSDHGANG